MERQKVRIHLPDQKDKDSKAGEKF